MVIVMELSESTLKYLERFLCTSALELTKLFVIISSRLSEERDIEVFSIASTTERLSFISLVNGMYFSLQARLMIGRPARDENIPVWPVAVKEGITLALSEQVDSLTLIYSTMPERAGALIDLLADSQLTTAKKLKINSVNIGDACCGRLEEYCGETGGSIVNMSSVDNTNRQLCLRSSVDLDLIDRETATVADQSERLVGIKKKTEIDRKTTKGEEEGKGKQSHGSTVDATRSTVWIPSRDTLLTISRKKAIETTSSATTTTTRPRTAGTGKPTAKKHTRLSRSAQSPALLHSRQFYLHGGSNLAKGRSIHMDASVKPPPIIPSCLKVPDNEIKSPTYEWLKRHGLNALKINLSRWERRVTPGSKVYRGVLPVVRDRHCELQVAELEQLEVLSTDAAKRYLKRIKWYLADAHRLWFQSCLHTFDQNQTVVIIDTSDSAKSWMHEAVTVLRSLSNHTSGKLNFIQFNGNR